MFASVVALVLLAAKPAPLPLDDANFDAVFASVQPPENDVRFEKVPWRTRLWEAALEANKADRPILLWAMNGHPLGCV